MIPLILILPRYFGLEGVWYAFPIADVGTAIINFFFLRFAYRKLAIEEEDSFGNEEVLDANVNFGKK